MLMREFDHKIDMKIYALLHPIYSKLRTEEDENEIKACEGYVGLSMLVIFSYKTLIRHIANPLIV